MADIVEEQHRYCLHGLKGKKYSHCRAETRISFECSGKMSNTEEMSNEECSECCTWMKAQQSLKMARSRRATILKRLRANSRQRLAVSEAKRRSLRDECCAVSICSVSTHAPSLTTSSTSSQSSLNSALMERSLQYSASSRSVSFKENVAVFYIPPISDLPVDVCNALWFTRAEIRTNLRIAQMADNVMKNIFPKET